MKTRMGVAMAALLMTTTAFAVDENANNILPKPQPATEETMKPHFGIVAGYGDITGTPKGAFNYGVDMGFQPIIPFGIGLQVNYMQSEIRSGADWGRLSILPKFSYNFGGEIPILKESFIGVKTGAVLDNFAGRTHTRFAFGPELGFDIPFYNAWTVGLEVSYLVVTGPEKNNDSFHTLGAVKYWF